MEERANEPDGLAPESDIAQLLRLILSRLDESSPVDEATERALDRLLAAQRDREGAPDLALRGGRVGPSRAQAGPARLPVTLSPREREIVRLVARGHGNKTMAQILDISTWTVATHLRRIFAKLEVNSRAEMVARALEAGLIGDDVHPPARRLTQ